MNFTNNRFAAAGIFAIIGPAGSGKSTLLDAICLALYGATPRLGKITQKDNDVMSRHTGECDAEVTFSYNSGVYTCKWHQHRAQRNPTGRLTAQFEQQRDTMANLRESLGAVKEKLNEDTRVRKQTESLRKKIGAQLTESRKWQRLHELIGSADVKKYRNFARGLTFERLIAHANRQLVHMTDCYLLLRNENEPLNLDVMDNHQAGEIRTTRNLSGGESFVVSLALGLGQVRMASQNVQIDSLFLDEGFGTLDDAALDLALDTLNNLQQDGKLIDVISQAPALKERIGCQIRVLPQPGGISRPGGTGCYKGGLS